MSDPMEKIIEEALASAGVRFERNALNLDFLIKDYDVYIEVKQFHSNRIAEQMSRAENVIAVQGKTSAFLLAHILKGGKLWKPT